MEFIHLIITYTISIVRFGFYKDNQKHIALLKILVSRVGILKRFTVAASSCNIEATWKYLYLSIYFASLKTYPGAVGLKPWEDGTDPSRKEWSVLSGLAPGKELKTQPGNVLSYLLPSLLILTTSPHSFPSILPKPGLGWDKHLRHTINKTWNAFSGPCTVSMGDRRIVYGPLVHLEKTPAWFLEATQHCWAGILNFQVPEMV